MGAVEDYMRYYGAHQWQQLRTVFDHSDLKRTGYKDVFTDLDKYVDFLEVDFRTFVRSSSHRHTAVMHP